jgi:hypothetical protein
LVAVEQVGSLQVVVEVAVLVVENTLHQLQLLLVLITQLPLALVVPFILLTQVGQLKAVVEVPQLHLV